MQQLGQALLNGIFMGQQAMGVNGLGNAEADGLARVQGGKRVLKDVLDLLLEALAACTASRFRASPPPRFAASGPLPLRPSRADCRTPT